jgi:hypothetical protein
LGVESWELRVGSWEQEAPLLFLDPLLPILGEAASAEAEALPTRTPLFPDGLARQDRGWGMRASHLKQSQWILNLELLEKMWEGSVRVGNKI